MRLLYIEFSDCKDVLAEAYRSGDVLRHSRIAPWGSPAVKDLDTIVVRLRSVCLGLSMCVLIFELACTQPPAPSDSAPATTGV